MVLAKIFALLEDAFLTVKCFFIALILTLKELPGKALNMLSAFLGALIFRIKSLPRATYNLIARNKKKLIIVWACVFVAVIAFIIAIFNITVDYYMLTYNGAPIGYSRSEGTVNAAVSEISAMFADDSEITDDIKNFSVSKITSSNWFISCLNKNEFLDVIVYASDTLCNGYSLYIDGEMVAALRNKEMLDTVINNYKIDMVSINKYLSNNNDSCTVTFKEKLEIKHEYLPKSVVTFKDEYKTVYAILEERINYTIECLQTEQEKIPYVTYYTRNDELRAGQKKVIRKGVNGVKDVQYQLIVENGELISKTQVNETITKSAVTARIQIGSGVSGGLGSNLGLIFPVDGYITSPYGDRKDPFTGNPSNHNGLDIGAPKGTPIYAASGGKVIQAGDRKNGFGLCVKIEHSSGFQTLYGHCSELLVEEGQYVSAGELIARVGSTGRSTGNHLHFSIIIDGKWVDPTLYY